MGIKGLSIRAVRGIRHEITLPLNGKSWLVHGDNGTGKSSIERALRWALLGTEEPSSEKALSTEASCRRHILEAGDSPKVVVDLDGGGSIEVCPATLKANEAGNAFRNACCMGNPFLRRLELLEFLNSKPVDRFRYLDSFLDLVVVDNALQKLSDKEKELGRLIAKSEQAIQNALTHLGSRLPSDLRPASLMLNDFRMAAVKLGVRLKLLDSETAIWEQLSTARTQAESLSQGDGLETARRNLSNASELLKKVGESLAKLRRDDLATLDGKRAALEQTVVFSQLAPLLEHARQHIAKNDGEHCPLCGQVVDRKSLLEDIDRKLIDMTEYRNVVQKISLSARLWRDVWKEFVQVGQALCQALSFNNLSQLPELRPTPNGAELLFDPQLSDDAFRASLLVVGPSLLLEWCEHVAFVASKLVDDHIATLPPATALGELRAFADVVKGLEENRESITLHERAKEQANKRQAFLQTIHESMRKARQDVAQEVLVEIGAKVAEYYSAIHPEAEECEVTKAPSIEVQRHSGGTAFVRGDFASQPVKDPKWVYSDGHLDTVGICIFLALRRYRAKNVGDPKLMVLDDVVLSIDLGHARRLITLLRDEFKDHQLLIFTHNGLFARWCLGLMPGLKKLDVLGWTLETGPRISDYASTIQRLTEHIEKSPSKEIAMNLMWLMDEWLAECRFAYSLSVPARLGDEYTLTEIWEPFAKSVRDLAKQFGDELQHVTKILDSLLDVPRIRNMLAAHENEFAQEFPRTVISDIAGNAIALVRAIYCIECHTFASPVPNRHQPQLLTCRCEQIRYIRPSKAQRPAPEKKLNDTTSPPQVDRLK
jgi:recombinational DNA repair ATPase RecF